MLIQRNRTKNVRTMMSSVFVLLVVTTFHLGEVQAFRALSSSKPLGGGPATTKSSPYLVRSTTGGSALVPVTSTTKTSLVQLHMSDVPQDDDDPNHKRGWYMPFRWELPPAPEDQFVLIGDLLALFVYSFSDHFVCQDLASYFVPKLSEVSELSSNMLLEKSGGALVGQPVWLDATSSYHSHVIQVLWHDATVTQYSPLLQPTGLAACALASCWLLAGWWHKAFLYRNTLDCSTPHTLRVTAKAWFTACLLLMVAVGITSNALSTTYNEYWWQAYTRGDMDYIWDSLTVLCVWRYMASSLLGAGGSDDRHDE